MRVLITEYICGGGLANDPLPESLQQEGQIMLQALLTDCLAINNCAVMTTLDKRLSLQVSGCEIVSIHDATRYVDTLVELATQVDYVWVVAPESDQVLENIIRRLQNTQATLINCDVQSIRVCADKLKCANELNEQGVDVVPSLSIETLRSYFQKVLIKPRYGVGCEGVQVFSSGLSAVNQINNPDVWIAQPYIQGEHCSMSMLCYQGEAVVLTCNRQELSNEMLPKLNKCVVNAFPTDNKLIQMANRIAYTFPGLQGYVGVDFIKTNHNYVVVEVNPRLTTSYIGLQKALTQNPAQLCLDTFIQQILPKKIELKMQNVEVDIH